MDTEKADRVAIVNMRAAVINGNYILEWTA